MSQAPAFDARGIRDDARSRLIRTIAWGTWVLSALLVAATWVLLAVTLDRPVPEQFGARGLNSLVAIAFATVGLVVTTRRPDHRIGWLLCLIGLIAAVNGALAEWGALAAQPDSGLSIPTPLAWLLGWLWIPLLGLTLVVLPLIYPTGTLLSRRWRPVAVLAALSIAAGSAVAAVAPGPIDGAEAVENPIGLSMDRRAYEDLFLAVILFLLASAVLSVASLIRRYRTSGHETRLQIKWLALACAIAAGALVLVSATAGGPTPGPLGKVAESLLLLSILGVAFSVGLAILRYRLYDIDRIISRSLGWTLVSAVLAIVFAGAVVALQQLLAGFTQGQTLAVAMSTLLALALFQPLRVRVQRSVDRRFDRARYDAERTAAAFSSRLRDRLDLTRLEQDVGDTVRDALRPRSLGIWVRGAADPARSSAPEA